MTNLEVCFIDAKLIYFHIHSGLCKLMYDSPKTSHFGAFIYNCICRWTSCIQKRACKWRQADYLLMRATQSSARAAWNERAPRREQPVRAHIWSHTAQGSHTVKVFVRCYTICDLSSVNPSPNTVLPPTSSSQNTLVTRRFLGVQAGRKQLFLSHFNGRLRKFMWG